MQKGSSVIAALIILEKPLSWKGECMATNGIIDNENAIFDLAEAIEENSEALFDIAETIGELEERIAALENK